jgi:transposase
VDAAALYEEGMSIRAVAARIGRSYEFTRRRLIRAGVQLRRQAAATEPAPVAEEFARLYGDGLSIAAVAEETGYPYSYVRRQLLLAGVTLRPGARRVEADPVAEHLAGLYRRDLSLRAIQQREGYSYDFIRTRLLAAGVELRDHQGRHRKAVA